jgi:2-methylcitrate dehydratase PrpD
VVLKGLECTLMLSDDDAESCTVRCGAKAVRGETAQLAEYAAALRYEDIPADVIHAAKNTIADGIAACVFGYRFPWSQAIVRYAQQGGAGKSAVLGPGAPMLPPPFAALVNGALAHSFELDAGTRVGVGAHPFGTVFTAALPVAQDKGLSGKKLITAFIAGSEAMLRIGRATGRSNEHRGFHAPGTTGPFGAAIASSLLLGLDTAHLLNAIGIAGSVACGLLQFSVSDTGSMVKRLHFGRAAEVACSPQLSLRKALTDRTISSKARPGS